MPFLASEWELLRLFSEIAKDLDGRTVADSRQFTFHIDASGERASGASRSDLKSVSTVLRKLAVAEREPAPFNVVRNLLHRHAVDAATPESAPYADWLRGAKKARSDIERHSLLGYVQEDESGVGHSITPAEILDLFINGVVFHTDVEKRRRWLEMDGLNNPAVAMSITTTLSELAQLIRALARLVDRILVEPSLKA